MIYLWTCEMGKELYEEGKSFFAENKRIYDDEDTEAYQLGVEDIVKLQVQYEKDGVTVYNVKPEQVFNIKKF